MRLTCPANWAESRDGLVERREEIGELVELLRRQVTEGGHDARADLHRTDDRGARDPLRDVGQFWPGAVVAVLAKLVASKAARAGNDLLAGFVLGRNLHVDLRWRTSGRAKEGEIGHRDDRHDSGCGRDRTANRVALRAPVVE